MKVKLGVSIAALMITVLSIGAVCGLKKSEEGMQIKKTLALEIGSVQTENAESRKSLKQLEKELSGLEKELIADSALLERALTGQACEVEKEAYLNALAKYAFDLSNLYLVYANTLTENEASFLQELESRISSLENMISTNALEGKGYGYTEEEKASRYQRAVSTYVICVEELCQRNADDGTQLWGDYTDYGKGVTRGYVNKGRAILLYGNYSTNNAWEPAKYFYGPDGNVIYVKYNDNQFFIREGEIVMIQPQDSGFADKTDWLNSMLNNAAELKRRYETNYMGIG